MVTTHSLPMPTCLTPMQEHLAKTMCLHRTTLTIIWLQVLLKETRWEHESTTTGTHSMSTSTKSHTSHMPCHPLRTHLSPSQKTCKLQLTIFKLSLKCSKNTQALTPASVAAFQQSPKKKGPSAGTWKPSSQCFGNCGQKDGKNGDARAQGRCTPSVNLCGFHCIKIMLEFFMEQVTAIAGRMFTAAKSLVGHLPSHTNVAGDHGSFQF